MYPFLESIRIDNGSIQLKELHEQRMIRTIHYAGGSFVPHLEDIIAVPPAYKQGTVKCRLLYSASGNYTCEFEHYTMRKHTRIGIKEVPGAQYSYKFSDRTLFTHLLAGHTGYDDIILTVNGLLTDASYANLVLVLNGGYYTPAQPLLQGVQREHLINNGVIQTADLTPADLFAASGVIYINALLPLGAAPAYLPDIFEVIG